ncbi:5'-3' exonuclease [Kibdelosporangium banguiense]|uniref:5'-3' exonuclease n=1 Tax=Kibdelosporangium banguiense TaxID=1365924 RepID=A0ABS4TMQ3_9PSEU|nr:5'-3' exonuclease [Kibdelosporangium banguiense]MBP2325687.1 5'-3' exonuclease [Kibdelosporangium banguiense]
MTAPLALLDSASLYFRAFYALPDSMTAPDGTSVNAVRGFADTVARILTDRRPGRLVACLDADWRPDFRVNALPTYKAHRVAEEGDGLEEEVPDKLTPQVPIILDLLDAVGLCTAEAVGYEADDVIGALVHQEKTDPVEVISGDRDMFQVVRHEPTPATVWYVGRGWNKVEVIGPAELAAKYDLPVEDTGPRYADMAVLRGDPSDGLPGVPSIGEKTAAKLIREFGTLQALIAGAEAGDKRIPKRAQTNILASADYLAAAPTVVAVAVDAPVVKDRDDKVPTAPADLDRVLALKERWDLGASIDRLLAAIKV